MSEKIIKWRECNNASGRYCVRYVSGLSWYEETLYDGRWITSSASTKGIAEEDPILYGSLNNNSAFEINIDGQSLHRGWRHVRTCEEPREDSCVEVVVVLESQIRPVRVYVHTLLTGTAVLTRWLEIENIGDVPAAMGQLAVWSGRVFPTQSGDVEYSGQFLEGFAVPHGPFEMGYTTKNKCNREGNFRWLPIDTRDISIGSQRGKSGWGHPIVYLKDKSCGEIFMLQLAWSGNWSIDIKRDDYFANDGHRNQRSEILFAKANVVSREPQRVISPCEKIVTPEVYFGRMSGGITSLVQQMHDHHELCVIPTPPEGCENLISYNHAGYDITANISDERLRREIEIAAELGADVFTIDAGWASDAEGNWGTFGDWYPGGRLSDGLEPIFDYARSKGLKCGLWAWIEAADNNSQLIKEHPDWQLDLDGKRLNNLLDLSKPEVASWVEEEILRLVETYDLDLFRLDYNHSSDEGGYNRKHGYDENTIWRHYEALYGIFERIRKKYPKLILENCAGGGGRTDMGMLRRMHYTWLSDNQTLPHAVRVLNTALLTMPPKATAIFFGVCMNAHMGGNLQTHLRTSFMTGNPALIGVWPEHEDKNLVLYNEICRYMAIFREHIRPIIQNCLVYHHTIELPGDSPIGWCVLEYAARDKHKSVIGIFRLGPDDEPTRNIRPKGLLPGVMYSVYCDNDQVSFECSGRELMNNGLNVTLEAALTSELLIITQIG